MNTKKTLIAATLAAILTPVVAVRASAQAEKLNLSDSIQSLKFGGDFRLRNDTRDRRGAGMNDVSQQRFRLRFGMEAGLPNDMKVAFRLASGAGEQVSANQTAGKLESQKALWIDLAYLNWNPSVMDGLGVSLTGGKLVNPIWRPYSADLVWDEDVTPEGLGESVDYKFDGAGMTVFANGLQMVAGQNSNSGKNQWEFSSQVGVQQALPMSSTLRVGAAYHKWSDENRASFSQVATQDGNRRAGGVLTNRFGVGEVSAEWKAKAMDLPVSVQGTVIRNLRALSETAVGGPRARDGYQYGLIVGAAKAKGSWEAAYFHKYEQTDATVADVADSDFGDGGTNRRGHIVWVAYAPADWLVVKGKYFVTDVVDHTLAPNDKAVNRLQLDLAVKF